MEDEVAKCIAEGIADRTLDTLEKKVKREMGDVGKGEMPAGLGKLYFCRVEDLKDNPDAHPIPLGEAVSIKPGMLTHKEDGDARPDYSAKGFSTTFTGTMKAPSDELMDFLGKPLKCNVELQRQLLGRMPRKMKKAYRTGSCYRRDTKWKRKAKAYERRFVYRLPDAEIVVTREPIEVIKIAFKGGGLQSDPDAVVSVSGKDIGEKMAAFVRRKQAKLEAL